MDTTRILDVLEPYEEECLFGWVTRMLRHYSATGVVNKQYIVTMQKLFGDNVSFPGLYFQNGLKHFVENSSLRKSCKLSSVKNIIDEMTIFPFYAAFLSKDIISNCNKYFIEGGKYDYLENLANIRYFRKPLEGNNYIKICPVCFEKQKCLKREHQIPGNFMCFEHKEVLQCFEYKSNVSKTLNFEDQISNSDVYDLNCEEKERWYNIAIMVHKIFQDGLKIDIVTLKQKIRSKLRALGYMNENYVFYDFTLFLSQFSDFPYFVNINKRFVFFQTVYEVSPHVDINPIFYLVLIDFLFGNMNALYEYEIEYPHGIVSKSYNCNWDMFQKYEIEHYLVEMKKEYFEEYKIIGDTEDSIIVLHKKCGTFFRVNKSSYVLRKCRWCLEHRLKADTFEDTYQDKGEYIHYLTTREYAKCHGKERRQIYNYCGAGRIDGAILIGNEWLIPEDAPYPMDKRKKSYKSSEF